MFQSSDDVNIDEEFLSDAFDIPSTNNESSKRNSDPLNDQPVKKICTQSSDDNTKNILSIIKSKSLSQTKFTKPNNAQISNSKPLTNKNVSNHCLNQEKNRRVVQRKFPGPAGILPEHKQLNINMKTLEKDISINNETLESDKIVCSQLSEDIFKKGPWFKMISDWYTISNRICLPNKYTISWTKSVAKKLIAQKTPFLAAVIQTVDCSSEVPMILLKDKTDEIHATLLQEVWEEYCKYLNPGSVIVLKQVGVLSTLKKQYLPITLNNLVAIYSEQENEETGNVIETTNIQEITAEEFIRTIENTKQSYEAQKVLLKLHAGTNNPYFKKQNTNKPIIPNEIKHNSISVENESNISRTPNKFNFNAQNKENKQVSIPNTKLTSIEKEMVSDKNSEEEDIILSQVLDGVDTDSLFEDF